jgi:ribose transport system substrate-binding protein
MTKIRALPRGVTALAIGLTMLAGPAMAASTGAATGSTASDGIALSNSYAGNTWRQQMLKTWDAASKLAIDQHIVSKAKVVNSNNSAPEQASQIQDLILEGWKAIVIGAASPTALNGVIQQACQAHITVVVFDSLATAPCAYKVAYNYVSMGQQEIDFVARKLNGKGNLLEVRGIAGTSVDDDIHKGIDEEIKKYPGLKVVGSVHGNWTQSIAQKEVAGVLPSLPQVDAVVTQGGDGYGTYEAFKQAGRKTPLIIMGNRQDELALWKQLAGEPGGYSTFSLSSAPGCASIAFWVAQQVLAGKQVPKAVQVPLLVIQPDQLDAWLKAVPTGGVATPVYTQEWTAKLIDANADHTALPASPLPGGGA